MASDAKDDIQVETEEPSAVSRAVTVSVAAERVDAAFAQVFKKLGRSARVKGFRPGKVPASVIERVYGPAAAEEIEQQLVRETISDALELAGAEPVTEPDIDADPPRRGEAFRYVARVEVRPVIELPALDGLEAEKPKVTVGQDEVLVQLEALRERSAPLIELPEDSQAETGHTLNIDFEGRIDDVPFEGGAGKDVELELGSGRFIPGFEEQLTGARAGEQRSVTVTFPDDYGEESLRGKQAVFAVEVRTLRSRQLPELDDEFAKDVGEDSLEALRERVRSDMETSREREARQALHQNLLDALIARTEFEVPAGLVERQLHNQMHSLERRFAGQVPEPVLRQELNRMREEGRSQAERRVREMLVIDAIARAEDIEAGPEEIEARLVEMAEAQGVPLPAFRQAAEEQGWHQAIAAELRDDKVLDLLAEKASITEVEAPPTED